MKSHDSRVRASAQKRGRKSYQPRYKYLVAAFWLTTLVIFWLFARAQGETPIALLRGLLTSLQTHPLSPLLLLGLYLVRPVFLLPITLLTLASGLLFGAFWGFFYALVAALASASVAYLFGRFFAHDLPGRFGWALSARLQRYPFETVLLCRFLLLPGDVVNYLAGFLRVRYAAFLAATAIGGVPGVLIGVLAGASMGGNLTGGVELNAWYLVASAALLGLSLGISWVVRRRTQLANTLGKPGH